MLGLGAISPFLPELAKQHGANGFWLGMIFAGFGISRGIVVPLVGKYADTIGRKTFVSTGLFLYTIIALTYPMTDDILTLTIVRLVHGLAVGMIIPILMIYIGELAEKGRSGVSAGALNMMFYLGLAAGPLVGGYMGYYYGFDSVFYLMSLLGGISFVIVVLFLPESAPEEEEKKEEKEKVTVASLLKYDLIKAVLIAGVLVTLMTVTFMAFVPSLADKIKMDPNHIGIILSVGILFAGLLQIPAGRVAERLDDFGKMIQIGTGTSIAMFTLFVMPFCPDFRALLLAGSIMGLGISISTSALLSLSLDIGKKTGMSMWMATYYTAINVGVIIAPLLAGIIMDLLGIDVVFYLFGLLGLFVVLAGGHYIRKKALAHN